LGAEVVGIKKHREQDEAVATAITKRQLIPTHRQN